ncbi:hypothetical protein OAO01_00940 [Oligoflexia bacterium]|nr:hypothetical protein [Oligoflexia bacterium]
MENQTFRSRLASLIQKCRKAIRLYTSMGRMHTSDSPDYSERQIEIWREVNIELLRELSEVYNVTDARVIVSEVYALRDLFYSRWRKAERELHVKQGELVVCAEKEDFIKSAILSKKLVIIKAQSQASQAAYQELQSLAGKSKASPQTITSNSEVEAEATDDTANLNSPLLQQAKVIPMRRRHRH